MKLDNRLWVLVAVLLSGAMLAGGWFIGVQPQLQIAAEVGKQRDSVEMSNTAARAELAALAEQLPKLPELEGQLDELQLSVPAGVGGSTYIAELNRIADESGVTLRGVAFEGPRPYAPTAAIEPTDATETAETAESTETAEEAPAAPSGPPPGPAPFADPLISAENLVIVPVTIEADGSDAALLDFLSRVQNASRLTLATTVKKTLTEGESGAGYSLSIGANLYVLKGSATALAEAAAAESAE